MLGRLGNPSSRAGSCERREGGPAAPGARGLDSVARDNLADSLMPQDRRCLPYTHSTGPGPTRLGVGPARAGRRRVIAGPTKLDTFTSRDAQPSTGHLP